jgi:hypothetical protein
MEIISFVVKLRSKPPLIAYLEVLVNVWSRPICICGTIYFKLNGIDSINKTNLELFS